jgi:hypothetical protein
MPSDCQAKAARGLFGSNIFSEKSLEKLSNSTKRGPLSIKRQKEAVSKVIGLLIIKLF